MTMITTLCTMNVMEDMYDTKRMEDDTGLIQIQSGSGTGSGVHMMKILYNSCTGGFRFSEAFLQEYLQRTGEEAPRLGCRCPHTTQPIRVHPVAIQIAEEFGLRWISGRNSRLSFEIIPAVFADYWEIDEYHGDETITVNVHHALSDVLERFMITGDYVKLQADYEEIKQAEKVYNTMKQDQARRPYDIYNG